MAGGKETPRQKMIGLMYLVLMAMLAMNVSKSILDSFLIINEGLEKSNESLAEKSEITMRAFEKSAEEDAKFKSGLEKAKKIKNKAEELYNYIDDLKKYVTVKTEGLDTALLDDPNTPDSVFYLQNIGSKDNYDAPTAILIGPDETNPKDSTVRFSGLELKMKIREFKELVLSNFNAKDDPAIYNEVNKYFGFDPIKESDGKEVPWAMGSFYHLPLAAIITNLSRIQLDVLNVEADAMSMLMGNVDKNRFKVDNLQAKVIANTNYVMMGDSLVADIFVSASSSSIVPEVYITTNQADIDAFAAGEIDESKATKLEQEAEGGIVRYGLRPGSEGDFSWGGFIKVKKPDGTYDRYPILPQKYTVAKKSLTVSATKMNIFYRGLGNPIKVAAPGIATKDIKVSCSNGSVSPKNKNTGEWIVKPGKGKEATITLSGMVNGKNVVFGKSGFRVKDVPPPTPFFAGVTGSGTAPASKVKASLGVIAKLQNFEFDGVRYNVTSFTLSTMYKGNLVEKKARGNKVTSDQKSILNSLRSGSKLYVEDIVAKGPSGKPVKLGGIKIKIL